MSKRFMVATEERLPTADTKITKHLIAKQWGVWHYITGLWLLSGVPDSVTPKAIYDELIQVHPVKDLSIVVIEIADVPRYWGAASKDSWEWMKNFGVLGG